MKNPVIPIFAGLLGLLAIWFALASKPEDVEGNLLPELIGFCLEGIFFVGIFAWMQERKELERRQELRSSLAGSLGFLCQLINSSLPKDAQVLLSSSDNWSRQARTNGRSLKQLVKKLETVELEVDDHGITAIQQLLQSRLATLDSLLSVSAELSHAHLSAFTLILTEIHKIATHHYYGDAKELEQSFSDLLRLLVSFNQEQF